MNGMLPLFVVEIVTDAGHTEARQIVETPFELEILLARLDRAKVMHFAWDLFGEPMQPMASNRATFFFDRSRRD